MKEYTVNQDMILFTANKQCIDDIMLKRADETQLATPSVTTTADQIKVTIDQPQGFIKETIKTFNYPMPSTEEINAQYLADVLNGNVTEIINE